MIKRHLHFDTRQLAWLAGLLEGEAYFGLHPTSKQSVSPVVELNTVNHDVILRVQRLYRERYGVAVNIRARRARRATSPSTTSPASAPPPAPSWPTSSPS